MDRNSETIQRSNRFSAYSSPLTGNEQGFAQGFALCKIQVIRSPEGLRAGAKPCSLYGKPEGISVQRFAA